MHPDRRRIWIELTPIETLVFLVVLTVMIGVSFGLGLHYGESGDVGAKPRRDREAMASIEAYLKENQSAFHFQKILNKKEKSGKQYLYKLDAKTISEDNTFSKIERKSPSPEPLPEREEEAENGFLMPETISIAELSENTPVISALVADLVRPEGSGPHNKERSKEKHEERSEEKNEEKIEWIAGDSAVQEPLIPVLVDPVPPPPVPMSVEIPAEGPAYVIQVESFDVETRALRRKSLLEEKGFAAFIEEVPGKSPLPYRLFVGPYESKDAAQGVLDGVRAVTRPDAFVRQYARP